MGNIFEVGRNVYDNEKERDDFYKKKNIEITPVEKYKRLSKIMVPIIMGKISDERISKNDEKVFVSATEDSNNIDVDSINALYDKIILNIKTDKSTFHKVNKYIERDSEQKSEPRIDIRA